MPRPPFPSPAVAAEPAAWRWRNHIGDFDWSEWHPLQSQTPDEFRRQFSNGFARGEFELEPLYAVRGDRETTILECAKIAKFGAKECTDGDTDWHKGYRYAANATALEIESAILSLQSKAGEASGKVDGNG